MALQVGDEAEEALKRKIRGAFSVFDKDSHNTCDVREVGTIIRSLNIFPTEKQLQLWIIQIEEDEPTGFIVYEKFEALVLRLMTEEATSHKRNTEDEILAAFEALDEEGKGYLEKDQLARLMTSMGEKFSPDEVKEMMSASADDDGKIYYQDFAELLAEN